MASTISFGSSGTFGTGTAKPSVGETITREWGDLQADNSGYVFYRDYKGPGFDFSQFVPAPASAGFGSMIGTYFFKKFPEFGTLNGSYNLAKMASTGGAYAGFLITLDGTSLVSTVYNSASGTANYSGTIAKSISHLTNGNFYVFTAMAVHNLSIAGSKWLTASVDSWFIP